MSLKSRVDTLVRRARCGEVRSKPPMYIDLATQPDLTPYCRQLGIQPQSRDEAVGFHLIIKSPEAFARAVGMGAAVVGDISKNALAVAHQGA